MGHEVPSVSIFTIELFTIESEKVVDNMKKTLAKGLHYGYVSISCTHLCISEVDYRVRKTGFLSD